MNKFKIGDRVKIIKINNDYPGVVEKMKEMFNDKKEYTIFNIGDLPSTTLCYYLEEDKDKFYWRED